MLKNGLISISALVFLGLAATKNSAFAMKLDEENIKGISVVRIANDPEPSIIDENDGIKVSTYIAPGQLFPNELLVRTFSFLNYLHKISAGKVCHLWNSLVQISLSKDEDYTSRFFSYCYKEKEFSKAFSFLEKFHLTNSKLWKEYVYKLLYTLPNTNSEIHQDPEIDPESIKNLIGKFQEFFPEERKNENMYNLSLAQFPQYKDVFCFLNQPIDDSQFSRGFAHLVFSFPTDVEAWKIFSNYLHELLCEYDTFGNLIRVQKDIIPTDRIKAFLRLFSEKFPKEQDHLSIISLSTAVEFMKEEQKKPQPK